MQPRSKVLYYLYKNTEKEWKKMNDEVFFSLDALLMFIKYDKYILFVIQLAKLINNKYYSKYYNNYFHIV